MRAGILRYDYQIGLKHMYRHRDGSNHHHNYDGDDNHNVLSTIRMTELIVTNRTHRMDGDHDAVVDGDHNNNNNNNSYNNNADLQCRGARMNQNDDDEHNPTSYTPPQQQPPQQRRKMRINFLWFCIGYSINHAAGLSCVALAALQFQQQRQQQSQSQAIAYNSSNHYDLSRAANITNTTTGTFATPSITTTSTTSTTNIPQRHPHVASDQDSLIYISYTLTAFLGVPRYVQRYLFHGHTKSAVVLGMYLFTLYVMCFWVAIVLYPQQVTPMKNDDDTDNDDIAMPPTAYFCDGLVYFGAIMGGMGAAIASSNQGLYYTQIVQRQLFHPPPHQHTVLGKEMTLVRPSSPPGRPNSQSRAPMLPIAHHQRLPDGHSDSPALYENSIRSVAMFSGAITMDDARRNADTVPNGADIHGHEDDPNEVDDALATDIRNDTSTLSQQLQHFASMFAFCLLFVETLWNCITILLIHYLQWNWHVIFATYTVLSFVATIFVQFYCTNITSVPSTISTNEHVNDFNANSTNCTAANENSIEPSEIIILEKHHHLFLYICYDTISSTMRLLVSNSKIKYLFGYVSAFALSSVYLNIFITGEVAVQSLSNSDGSADGNRTTALDVSFLITLHGMVAAISAFGFGCLPMLSRWCRIKFGCSGNGHGSSNVNTSITMIGSVAFALIAIPFLFHPSINDWSFGSLVLLYSLQGVGRATFEGTFKAMIANYFPEHHQKDAAFANVIFQHGLISAMAYGLVDHLTCSTDATSVSVTPNITDSSNTSIFCVQYGDGTYQNIWMLSWILIGSCILAIAGLLRSAYLNATSTTTKRFRKTSFPNYNTVALSDPERNHSID